MQTEFEGGAKRTGRKPVYHLVMLELMAAVADTRVEGDCKYGVNNWTEGDEEFFVDCLGHAIEHLMLCAWDEDESLETHLGHAATNIGFILWALKRRKISRESLQSAALIVGRSTPNSTTESSAQPSKTPLQNGTGHSSIISGSLAALTR
jgi:hypothetical protein